MGSWTCEWCGQGFTRRGTAPKRFCSREHSDAWARRDKPSDEWLRTEYIEKRRTANDIAEEVGRHPKRVWEWLVQAGIPTRPRGSYNTEIHAGKIGSFKGKTHSPESVERMTAARRSIPREAYAGNGHYLRDRPGAAHPNWKGGATPLRQGFYASHEWKKVAQIIWARDKSVCQRCGTRPPKAGPRHNRGHIHHIISFQVEEFRAELTNLVLLCADCHRWVHSNANTTTEFIKP